MNDLVLQTGAFPWITAIVFLPILGILLLFAVGKSRDRAMKWIAFLVTGADFVLSLPLWFLFDRSVPGMQFAERTSWISVPPIQYSVGVDGISLPLLLMTTFLMPLCVMCSWTSIQTRVREYLTVLLVMETAMLGVFVALDFVLFYIFWEAMLIPMYLLIGVWGGPNRLYAAIKFFLYTLTGSVLLLVAILVLYFQGGHTFDILALTRGEYAPSLQSWLFWALFAAFAVKVPMFPFHTWLPDAHVEAPTAGSVILASVLLKMGTYGFLRFSVPMLPDATALFTPVMVTLSVVAIIYGAYMALAQSDLKKLIAYSSVSHMGFVTLGIFILNAQGIEGAVMQMVNHGITTGALFLCVGAIYQRTHSRQIADNTGLAGPMPRYATLLVIFSLSSLGLPGTNSFVGEFLVLAGTFFWSKGVDAVASLGIILAAAYLLYMVQRVVFGVAVASPKEPLHDLNWCEMAMLAPLVVLVFWIGLFPNGLLSIMHASVNQLIEQVDRGDFTVADRATGERSKDRGRGAGAGTEVASGQGSVKAVSTLATDHRPLTTLFYPSTTHPPRTTDHSEPTRNP